jgi:hypothetical protein
MLIPEPASCYYHKIFRIQMELSPSTLYNARGLPCLEWMLSLMLLLRGSIYVIIITLALPFSCLVKWGGGGGGRLKNWFVKEVYLTKLFYEQMLQEIPHCTRINTDVSYFLVMYGCLYKGFVFSCKEKNSFS